MADYVYDALGRRSDKYSGNSTHTSYTYDNLHRLINMVLEDPADITLDSYDYTYDKVGNRLGMQRLGFNEEQYGYDDLYRLVDVLRPNNASILYQYDPLGNREQMDDDGVITTYLSNEVNQYTNVDGTAYSYDNNGNLLDDSTNTYSYDYENRLIRAVTPDYTVDFKYDALGRRIEKTVDDGIDTITTRYYYDGAQVIFETDELGVEQSRYIYGAGIDEVLEMERGGQTYTYHYDGLGSVSEITDAAGAIVEKYEYDVFGRVSLYDGQGISIAESAIGNPYFFTGRRYDKEIGLYYYRARYYSPELGRFLQHDPLGYFDGPNLYTYVRNNPVNWVDPWGFISAEEFINQVQQIERLTGSAGGTLDSIRGSGYSSQSPGPDSSWRYIDTDSAPLGTLDMRHFMSATHYANSYGAEAANALGLGLEWHQSIREFYGLSDEDSGWNPDDIFSNALGAFFGENFFDPEGVLSEQLAEFFWGFGILTSLDEFNELMQKLREKFKEKIKANPKYIGDERFGHWEMEFTGDINYLPAWRQRDKWKKVWKWNF